MPKPPTFLLEPAACRRAAREAGLSPEGEYESFRLYLRLAGGALALVRELDPGAATLARECAETLRRVVRPGVSVILTEVGLGGAERIVSEGEP